MITKENQHTLSQKNHLSICHANLFYPPTHTLFKDCVYKYNYIVRIPRFPRFISVIYLFKPLNESQHI
jgi:hypothetical protein